MRTSSMAFFGSRRPLPPTSRPARLPVLPTRLRNALRQNQQAAAGAQTASRHGARNPQHRLLDRITLGWNAGLQSQADSLGYEDFLEAQLHPEEIDDFGLEAALEAAFPTLTMTPWERLAAFNGQENVPFFELILAALYRAVYSPRQLFERMAIFWTDHFNIDILSDFGVWLKPTDDRDVIRRHALGKFPDLLRASTKSAAMLDYLTNDSNVKGHPNENYARELMELHTVGVDGGYSQQDVREVARCFTGWAFDHYDSGPTFGRFRFFPEYHDSDPKTVLGVAFPGGRGAADAEQVIDLLLAHPETGRFVGRKLLRYLWGYEPDGTSVERMARVYRSTGGDIRAMVRSALSWFEAASATPKLKRPFHLVVSTLRALAAKVVDPFPLLVAILSAGHLPFNWAPPNGYPDSAGYWSGLVLPRWNFTTRALLGPESGLAVDLSFLATDAAPAALVDALDRLLLNGTMTQTTAQAVTAFLARWPVTEDRLRAAAGLVLAAPEFQHY
ncbi:MAG: DUF1800 domain-containing protein [Acidobacteriota bacterium]